MTTVRSSARTTTVRARFACVSRRGMREGRGGGRREREKRMLIARFLAVVVVGNSVAACFELVVVLSRLLSTLRERSRAALFVLSFHAASTPQSYLTFCFKKKTKELARETRLFDWSLSLFLFLARSESSRVDALSRFFFFSSPKRETPKVKYSPCGGPGPSCAVLVVNCVASLFVSSGWSEECATERRRKTRGRGEREQKTKKKAAPCFVSLSS